MANFRFFNLEIRHYQIHNITEILSEIYTTEIQY